MNKVKAYLENKPKLKKAIKILAVVGVILSVSFNILIIGVGSCSIHSAKHDSNEIKEPIATTPVKGMYQFNNNMYLASACELMDANFFTKLIKLAAVNTGTQTPTSFEVQNLVLHFNTPDYILLDNGTISTSGNIYVDKITLITASSGTTQNNLNYYRYLIKFSYGSTEYFSYNVDWYTNLDASNYFISLAPYVFGNLSDSGIRNYLFIFDRTSGNNEAAFNLLYNTQAVEQYDDGYAQGQEYGYNTGYTNGYADGQANARVGGDTNVFGLIKSAFASITNILNIQLIPGITLASIIFAPVIITMIIVIVKMFKG